MANHVFYFITVPMVYFAFAWCVAGCAIRLGKVLKSPKHTAILTIFPETKAPLAAGAADAFLMPPVRKYKPLLWVFLGIFHIGIALLILSHLDLLPQIHIMPKTSKHMIGYGAVGVAVTVSVLYFLFRRFRGHLRELSVPSDYLLLFLLFCVFITGDTISWANSWNPDGFVLTKADFGNYLNGLVRFTFADPRETLQGSHYIVMVIHVLLANVFLIVLPFSRIAHVFFAVPLNKLRRG